MNDASRTILGALVLSALVVTWRGAQAGSLTPRTYAALAVLAFMLLALGTFAPDLAAAFAVLVFVGVLLSGARDLEELPRLARRKADG